MTEGIGNATGNGPQEQPDNGKNGEDPTGQKQADTELGANGREHRWCFAHLKRRHHTGTYK
jgi:hypothetical protein